MCIIIDIDECSLDGITNCSREMKRVCMNTIGSYRCVCETGYKENISSNTCDGRCMSNLSFAVCK